MKGLLRRLRQIDRREFGLLLAGALAGFVAVLPYLLEIVETLPIDRSAGGDLPMLAILALALVQNGLVLAAAIAGGLILSERVGLRMPLVRAWARREPAPPAAPLLVPGALLGAAAGVALVAIEAIFFLRHLPAAFLPVFEIPLWKRLLAGVAYGGVTEEILMRLGLLSLVAWLLGKRWRDAEGRPTPGAFRAAIFLVALLFGLGHLPATAAVAPLTPLLVARALVLNGVAGVAFGWLYWRRGLEAAMVAHMSTHLVLQIPGVALIQALR